MNPYSPPVPASQKLEATPSIAVQILRIAILMIGSSIFAFFMWGLLLVLFFANSTEDWPGFACAIPAIAAGLGVCVWIYRWNPSTPSLLLLYFALDLFVFLALMGCLLYWRMYLYHPSV